MNLRHFPLALAVSLIALHYKVSAYYDSLYENETYVDWLYGYDESNFAILPDPYDETKSWSVKTEQECKDGQCESGISSDASISEISQGDTQTLHMYDNCQRAPDGSIIINGSRSCDLEVLGVDLQADLLRGGVDGHYRLVGCYLGKPMYNRVDGPQGEERTLFYDSLITDWCICIGSEPSQDQMVMYGDLGQLSPLDVPQWHVSAAFSSTQSQLMPSEDEDLYFVAQGVHVGCVGEAQPATGYDPAADDYYLQSTRGGLQQYEQAFSGSEDEEGFDSDAYEEGQGAAGSCAAGHDSMEDEYEYEYDSLEAAAAREQDLLHTYQNCRTSPDGSIFINGSRACDLEVLGVDLQADLLWGGVDGHYRLVGCYLGKPMYNRVEGPQGEGRTLFYHPYIGDWQICEGGVPNDDHLIMYGDVGCLSPLDVPQWHVSASLSSIESKLLGPQDLFFIASGVSVKCVGDMQLEQDEYDD